MDHTLSIADASTQRLTFAPRIAAACPPAGFTHPVAVEARDGATLSDVRLDRGHWAFDPAAYRRTRHALLYSPRTISALLLVATTACAVLMVAVALGVK